jgi:hypothetical protein
MNYNHCNRLFSSNVTNYMLHEDSLDNFQSENLD